MRKGCAAAGQNAVRQNVTQNAVRQNAFRYLRSRLQHQQASKLWISSRILCNNFLGALPLTPKEGSAETWHEMKGPWYLSRIEQPKNYQPITNQSIPHHNEKSIPSVVIYWLII